jgi:hypothetical protein
MHAQQRSWRFKLLTLTFGIKFMDHKGQMELYSTVGCIKQKQITFLLRLNDNPNINLSA